MTEYVGIEQALESVAEDGFHIADLGLFTSALVRPSMSVFGEDAYPTIWLKAAAQLESLARNHALADGNKRTALTLTSFFLALNDWDWLEVETNEDFVVRVATSEIDLETSAAYLEAHSTPL